MRFLVPALAFSLSLFALPAPGAAQVPLDTKWAADVQVGFDTPVAGNVHSAGIGTLAGLPTVIESRTYGDVYGTGVFFRGGLAYKIDVRTEVLASFTYQSVSADVVQSGAVNNQPLLATFDDYRAWGLDGGFRYYLNDNDQRFRTYVGATLGVAVINEIDADFAVPSAGLTLNATDFYDGTAALTLGGNAGLLYALSDRVDVTGEVGLRFVSGLAQIDGLQGTSLEDINDNSSRWALPLAFGVRVRF
jgi:hypothetical protein